MARHRKLNTGQIVHFILSINCIYASKNVWNLQIDGFSIARVQSSFVESEVKFVYLQLSPLEKGGPGIRQETHTRPRGRGGEGV